MTHFSLGHRPALDGIRGLAVSFVFAFHLRHVLFGDRPIPGIGGLSNGFLGVDIFFVLSGFLITTLLLQEYQQTNSISLRRFYARRALRLLPALVLFLTVIGIYSWLTLSERRAGVAFNSILYALFYSTNWISALRIAPVAADIHHTWSLAIEEQFYLLWPIALLLLLKLKISHRSLITIALLGIVAVCLNRVLLDANGASIIRLYEGSDTRADSLLVGCVVAMLLIWNVLPVGPVFRRVLGAGAFVAAITISLFVTARIPAGFLQREGFTVFAVATGIVLIQVVTNPPRLLSRLLELRGLVWLGKLSYGLYLWQIFAMSLVVQLSGFVKICLSIALTIAFASLSYYLLERPFLRLKKRFAAPLRREPNVFDHTVISNVSTLTQPAVPSQSR